MHADQLTLDPEVAILLLREQFAPAASVDIEPLRTAATTSYVYRVGAEFSARFPMRGSDATSHRRELEHEHVAMREFAAVSPLPSPQPVFIGEPGHGYPMPWTVQSWLPGTVVTPDSLAGSSVAAHDLADLVLALRRADARGRSFAGGGRGGELPAEDDWIERCLGRSEALLPVGRIRKLWRALRATPRSEPDTMSHKDLTPFNLLAGDGLVGVLDTGGFGPADPALDLVAGWHVLDDERRAEFRDAVAPSEHEWRRGAAWALQQALGLVEYYAVTNPPMSALGRSTLDRLLAAEELSQPMPGGGA